MAEANTMSEKLIAEFTQNYMEKLFYFCLKKTGNGDEAEDLTQDIALNILVALNNGTIPTSFSAWVWRIARNRYCAWADGKHRKTESVTGADIGDYEIEDERESTFDKMIRSEQLALLRRELAFVRSEYREIVVAYYIEDKSVRDIATSLSLSEGAVKQRLYRARNLLKEGMNMAREFGVRSYKPEDIHYAIRMANLGGKNQPKSIMEHTLYVNIFLEAYGNPSTAEELSLELGVALPYMENELEYLTRETFLIRKDGKYQTTFPILSRTAQEQVHVAKLTAAPEITKALISYVERLNDALTARKYAYYGSYQDYESAKWTLLMLAYLYFEYKPSHTQVNSERPDGGRWDIIGYQHCNVAKPALSVCNLGHSGNNYTYHQFRYEANDDADSAPGYLTEEETQVLYGFVTGGIEAENTEIAKELEKKGYLRKKGETYEPAILVLKMNELENTIKSLDAETLSELNVLAEKAKRLLEDLYHDISKVIISDLPAVFTKGECWYEHAILCCYLAREYVIAEALRQGYLLPPEKVSRVIGAHIEFK